MGRSSTIKSSRFIVLVSPLGNCRGQAAVFVALMFNVLFIFFAMSINVALVVHDKINLQNSVDLASYYAAMKQAEILNAIAHENYMIRQSYKLLAWRYRALGTMGLITTPKHPVWTGAVDEKVFEPAAQASICVAFNEIWSDSPANENLCRTEHIEIPRLPKVDVIAGFLGINYGIAALSIQLQKQFDGQCNHLGAVNWWFAMSIFHAFRIDQRNRKQIIYALARNLSRDAGDGDFIDLDGNSVYAGARETFVKNLTYANRLSFEGSGGKFKLMNSMTGIQAEAWLKEIQISPTLFYTDVDAVEDCVGHRQYISNLPARPDAQKLLITPLAAGGYQVGNLEQWRVDGLLTDDFQFSIGVEKNPWYMPFVGINASTHPRQIFFPFGDGIQMVARAYAKPFGGRIGPWYQSKWDHGAPASDGNLTDPLMAPRVLNGTLTMSPNDPRRLPNYSRFPGDPNGLTTNLAVNSLVGFTIKAHIPYDNYRNIKTDIAIGSDNDIVAKDNLNPAKIPEIRNFELAAIAPDLFDVTYYSIEPNFMVNYGARLNANRAALQIPSDVPIRGDLGSSAALPNFAVQDQMAGKTPEYQRPEAFYFIREKAHLLTSWLIGPGAFNYDLTESLQNFGKCSLPDDNLKFKTPGSCAAGGGRTGYSVKLVSRDALLSQGHKIGGPDAAAGAILNPPNAGEGW